MLGHVREAIESPHANFVLQKLIETMPPSFTSFVLDEIRGHVDWAARHRFGCRVVARLVEHNPAERVAVLLREMEAGFRTNILGLSHGRDFHLGLIIGSAPSYKGQHLIRPSHNQAGFL
jgi:hypothetical protein